MYAFIINPQIEEPFLLKLVTLSWKQKTISSLAHLPESDLN